MVNRLVLQEGTFEQRDDSTDILVAESLRHH